MFRLLPLIRGLALSLLLLAIGVTAPLAGPGGQGPATGLAAPDADRTSPTAPLRPQDVGVRWAGAGSLPAFGMIAVDYQAMSVAQARQSGAQSVMVAVLWSDLEPVRTNPPTYHWTEMDRKIALAIGNGLEPFVLVTGNPDWAYSGPFKILNAAGREALAEMAATAARRYRGQVRLWSFYNEPDCNGPTGPAWGDPPSSCYGNFGAEYTAMLQAVYPAVKAADPNAFVAMGGLAYDAWETNGFSRSFLDDVLKTGGGNYFDLMSFHYYPEFAATWNPYGVDVIGKTTYLQNLLASYGIRKPIVLTEISLWGEGTQQADYLVQGMTRAFAAGNELVMWYELNDYLHVPNSKFGLLNGDGTPKPAFIAYQLLSQKLAGITASVCPEARYPAIEAYRFRSPDGSRDQLVGWSKDGSSHVLPLRADRIIRHNSDGRSLTLDDAADGQIDGRVQVPVDARPVILDIIHRPVVSLATAQPFRLFFPLVMRNATCTYSEEAS